MARIIPLHGEQHAEIQRLLPWYVTARLDPLEQARIEAHLAACAECRAEVRSEQALKAQVKSMPAQVERDWARLRERIAAASPVSAGREVRGRRRAGLRPPAWVGWAIAAQILLVVLLGAQVASRPPPAEYRALAAAPAAGARIMVTFRPDSPEQELREALNAARATR
jgi:anti-sigma factor RsiW